MDNLVSPLIKNDHGVVEDKPLLDDPYAFVSKFDDLTRHEYYYISNKIEQGWITDRDIELVKFIHVHRWVTLSQITRLFFKDVEREETVRKRVNRLLKYGLLRRLQWKSYSRPKENKPSFYELGASGADILKLKFGTHLGHRDPRNLKPSSMLYRMRYVVTNEFYLQLISGFNLMHWEFHPVLVMEEEQQVPTAKFVLRNPKGRDLSFYLICHREDEKWMKTIRYQAVFFKNYFRMNELASILVVHISSDEKAEIAAKIMEQEGMAENTWFITDSDLYNPEVNLSKSFFSYQKGKKFYYDLQ